MASTRPVRIIAHRGNSAAAPENTLAAFASAAALPRVDLIECDVRLTADRRAVICHDPTLPRTTDGAGRVADALFAPLRRLDAGAWFSPAFAGQRIPTLGEALDAIAPRSPLIEIKVAAAIGAVLGELDRRRLARSALIQSFHLNVLAAIRRRRDDLQLGWLTERAPTARLIARARDLRLSFLSVRKGRLTAAAVARIRRAGMSVFAWTVNDRAEMRRLASLGADGLITNDPELAARALGARRRGN